MYKFAFVLFAIVALQGTLAKPGGKKGGHREGPIDRFVTETQTFVQNVTRTLGLEDLPDSQQVIDTLHTQARTFADNVDQFTDKLKTEVKAHQPEVDNVIKQVEAKLQQTATQIKQAIGPDATAKANEIKQNLDQGLKDAVEQIDKLVKAIEPDAQEAKAKVDAIGKDLLEQINEVGRNLQTQIQSTVQQHEQTHNKQH